MNHIVYRGALLDANITCSTIIQDESSGSIYTELELLTMPLDVLSGDSNIYFMSAKDRLNCNQHLTFDSITAIDKFANYPRVFLPTIRILIYILVSNWKRHLFG
jgi:hypothetical protein